jgi:hypothetical protein
MRVDGCGPTANSYPAPSPNQMTLPKTNTGHLLEGGLFSIVRGDTKQYPTNRPIEDIKVLTSDGAFALSQSPSFGFRRIRDPPLASASLIPHGRHGAGDDRAMIVDQRGQALFYDEEDSRSRSP